MGKGAPKRGVNDVPSTKGGSLAVVKKGGVALDAADRWTKINRKEKRSEVEGGGKALTKGTVVGEG